MTAPEGYALSFPGKVRTRTGREGPVVFRVDASNTPDGARFEAAWFGFPEPLGVADRAELRADVEAGLGSSPGTKVVKRVALSSGRGGQEGVDLVLDRGDGKRGFHRILYAGELAMLQVSAVGPRDGQWEREVPRFLESVSFEARPRRGPGPGPDSAPADSVLHAGR